MVYKNKSRKHVRATPRRISSDGLIHPTASPDVSARGAQCAAIASRRLNHTVLKASLISSCVAMACAAAPAMTQESQPASGQEQPATLPTVTVETQVPAANPYADPEAPYKADRLSSDKFTEPVLDTPRSVTIVTKEALEDKNATNLRELGRSTAGVTLGTGEGGNAFGDRFFIRGFDARNDIFVDGVRDPGVSMRENFFTEQVEILRGPASTFAGRGTTGGAINIVHKQAGDVDFGIVEATVGNDDTRRVTVDLNRTLTESFDMRLNVMGQSADVAGRESTTDNRQGVALAFTARPAQSLVVKGDYTHTKLWGLPDFGVPFNTVTLRPTTVANIAPSTYFGIINRDFTESTQNMGTLDVEWAANDRLTLSNKLRQGQSLLNYLGTTPENISPPTPGFTSTPTFFSGYTQLNAQSRYQTTHVLADQAEAIYKFDTGAWKHTAVGGLEFSDERLSINSYTGFTSEITTGVPILSNNAPVVSIYNPVNYLNGVGPQLGANPLNYVVGTKAAYLMDTADYGNFILNGGVRYDDYHITSSNNTSSQQAQSGITSYNVGLVVKPSDISSVYAAFATAADPVGSELDATSSTYGGLAPTQPSTQIFGPMKSRAYELGTKWELFQRHLLTTAALFQTNVENARETAPAGLPGYASGQVVAGAEYQVHGIDLEAAGKITQQWSVSAGAVFMQTKITKSIVPTNVGLRLANTANQSFNLLTKYQANNWLELGGQAVYRSDVEGGSLLAANGGVTYPNPPRPTVLPAYWRYDTFAEATINAHTSVKLYVQNILNERYYDAMYQSAQPFVQVAPGRSVSLIGTFKF
jgi:catecholate siderophore receptor